MEKQANNFFNKINIKELNTLPIIFADNLSTPENIGAVLRLADNIGVKKVFFINDDFNFRESKIKSLAKNAFKNIDWEIINENQILEKLPSDYKLIAIETYQNSSNLYKTKLNAKSAFVIGNEKHGINDSVLKLCDNFVHIPMHGNTKSMNVSHSLTVVLFEWLRQTIYN